MINTRSPTRTQVQKPLDKIKKVVRDIRDTTNAFYPDESRKDSIAERLEVLLNIIRDEYLSKTVRALRSPEMYENLHPHRKEMRKLFTMLVDERENVSVKLQMSTLRRLLHLIDKLRAEKPQKTNLVLKVILPPEINEVISGKPSRIPFWQRLRTSLGAKWNLYKTHRENLLQGTSLRGFSVKKHPLQTKFPKKQQQQVVFQV